MAARENQGLQIWLIVFASLWVISTGLTYWFYSKWQTETAAATAANTSMQEARNNEDQAKKVAESLKTMMGFAQSDDLSAIQTTFEKDKESYARGYAEAEQKSYRNLIKAMSANIRSQASVAEDAKASDTQTKAQLASVEVNSKNRIAEFQAGEQKAQGELGSQRNEWDSSLTKAKATTEKHAAKSAQYQQEVGSVKSEMKNKELIAEKAIKKRDDTIKDQKSRIDRIVDVNFEVEDGKILSIDQRTGVAIISLGAADNLKPKLAFKVYSVDDTGAHQADPKASLEVTRILGDHMAEALITQDNDLDPIFPQDKIYSPTWTPGRMEHVAFAGLIDIDGDGLDDKDKLRKIVELNGGVVDAETKKDGTVEGEMTLRTRFLIVGEESEIADAGDAAEGGPAPDRTGKAQGYGEMVSEARTLSITVIPVNKFLDNLGWRDANRIIPLDQHAKGEEFLPRAPEEARPGSQRPAPPQFKRRTPRAY